MPRIPKFGQKMMILFSINFQNFMQAKCQKCFSIMIGWYKVTPNHSPTCLPCTTTTQLPEHHHRKVCERREAEDPLGDGQRAPPESRVVIRAKEPLGSRTRIDADSNDYI